MKGHPGAAVVLDVASNKILASSGLEVAAQRLEQPGSAVKPFVLLALLNSGKIDPTKRLACHRPLYVGNRRMDCSHPPAVTSLDARDAIAWSCNTYFSTAATQLTGEEMARAFQRFGFTSLTGLAANEVAGRVATAREQVQVQLQALGHWGIEVTPLELLEAYRNLALLKFRTDDHVAAVPVFDGMERAVEYGIAHAAHAEGISAAGKTGTASGVQTPQAHGFFVGYAPADKPEMVVIVYLEHGRGIDAAAIAGPIFSAYAQARHKTGK